jgi:cytochrome P450
MVFMNIWGMSHDAAVYPIPETFSPERFLGSDLEPPYTFGAGRRVCVGQRFAENSIMLVMAKVAWAFDIGADPACPADPSVENGYHDGLSIAPKRFQVDSEVRSRKREETIGVALDTL